MSLAGIVGSLKKSWPLLLTAWAAYNRLAKDNPDLYSQVKDQVDAFASKVRGALHHRTTEERIAEMLDAAEETAAARATSGSDQQKSEARNWLRRAADTRQALAVAEKATGGERRRMLRQVRAVADALVADVFEVLIPGSGT